MQNYQQQYCQHGFQGQYQQNSKRAENQLRIRARKGPSLLKKLMLSFMGENKRLLKLHEQNFVELAIFQANTTMFQANTNVSLKNLEAQVGQLALTM